ncbi:MAG: MBL fold metallo-hydrolase [Candidatus Brocadiia bacterium]|jgi:glyoxylase-like metal-dependent hydrolase (beta-lactamase superfamily II)|nr:MBL fold metallo-hydrolase [Candidatus Brocadiia bacterium]
MAMRLIGPVHLIGGQDFQRVYVDWPANDANVYLVDTGDKFLMVDCGCGDSLPGILENFQQMGFDVPDITHLLLTHGHFPHAAAAEALQRMGVEVFAAAAAAEALATGDLRTAAYHYHREFPACPDVTVLEHGEEVEVSNTVLKAVALPGHSPGCMGYEIRVGEDRALLCGDVVRSPLLDSFRNRPGYDREAYAASLEMLLEDPPEILYPGHGPFCLSHGRVWIEEQLKKVLEVALSSPDEGGD